MSPTHDFLCAGVPLAANPQLCSSRVQESSGSAQCAGLKVNASVRKLLSTIKAHLVSPARNREWTAHVAMPAAKEPLEDGLYSKLNNLLPWQFAPHFSGSLLHAHVSLWIKENSSAVEKVLRNYRSTYCWEQSPWPLCFDHAAPSHAVKGDASCSRQICSDNGYVCFHSTNSGQCLHERSEANRQTEDRAFTRRSAVGSDAINCAVCVLD